MRIAPYDPRYIDGIVDLSLRAWAPVFDSMRAVMGETLFLKLYPDWLAAQRAAVIDTCNSADIRVWVSLAGDQPTGFVAAKMNSESRMGVVDMIAVDPNFQRQHIATALMSTAVAWLKDAGMTLVMVETGGDPGHAPARSTYENLGFGLMPIARYFKVL